MKLYLHSRATVVFASKIAKYYILIRCNIEPVRRLSGKALASKSSSLVSHPRIHMMKGVDSCKL